MSNELVAALIGALVGGLASGVAALGGSVVVNRIQLKKATRLRMYDEILPQVARPFGVLQDQFTMKADPLAPPEFLSLVDTKGNGSSWIFEPHLTCANALQLVQHPAFSLVT